MCVRQAENERLRQWWRSRQSSVEWQRMATARASLPMARHRKQLLKAVGGEAEGGVSTFGRSATVISTSSARGATLSSVAVVCGATGCGYESVTFL